MPRNDLIKALAFLLVFVVFLRKLVFKKWRVPWGWQFLLDNLICMCFCFYLWRLCITLQGVHEVFAGECGFLDYKVALMVKFMRKDFRVSDRSGFRCGGV